MSKSNRNHSATIAARANGAFDTATGGVVPGIGTASTFIRGADNALYNDQFIYGRDDSAIVQTSEATLSALENGEQSLLFPSGMAAIAAVVRSVASGGRIILQSNIYWGTTKWVRDFCVRRGVELIELDCSDPTLLSDAIHGQNPDIVFLETPSNPWLKITDIRKAAECCAEAGALLVVDSTAATPILTRPLDLGADIVLHSASKAINGHSDLLAGSLSVADKNSKTWQAIAEDRHDAGAIIGNFEAWLLLRGMRTLHLRVERMCQNAMEIAKFLSSHPNVDEVLYPGLPDNPGHLLASQQMHGGFGYLISFLVKGGREAALETIGALDLIHRATSLGGVESLIEHRQSLEDAIPDNLLRLSVGIENIDDLISDLDRALSL